MSEDCLARIGLLRRQGLDWLRSAQIVSWIVDQSKLRRNRHKAVGWHHIEKLRMSLRVRSDSTQVNLRQEEVSRGDSLRATKIVGCCHGLQVYFNK